MKRASFITVILLFAVLLASCSGRRTVLVVGGWNDDTIGVLAQTPGLLRLIGENLPDVDVIVWNKSYSKSADSVLCSHFPNVRIVNGAVDENGNVHSAEVLKAFEKADLLIHCSCSALFGARHIKAWTANTDKPYGIFATSFQNVSDDDFKVLEGASFIFARESASLNVLMDSGLDSSKLLLVPDSTFGFDLRNEASAESFMKANNLEDNGFICVITRLRITPYEDFSPEYLERISVINDSCKGPDHEKVRAAIEDWVRQTGKKVVLCPELSYEQDLMDELIIDGLPDDIKPFVLKHGYWFPDEAASLYSHACCVLSLDSHSPLIAICAGTPAIYVRQREDTRKGDMFHDLGLDDWLVELDAVSGEQLADSILGIYHNEDYAIMYLNEGLNEARKRLSDGMNTVGRYL